MHRTKTFTIALATAALMLAPGLALAGHGHNPRGRTGATSSTGSTGHRGNAFGVLCANESRIHIAGQKGTPFSQCVTALATEQASSGALSPAKACAGLSRRHARGMRGTPFSRCVVAAAHLRGSHGATGSTGATGATGVSGSTGAAG